MRLINVYVEHSSLTLNQFYTYSCPYPVKVGCRVKVDFAGREVIGFVYQIDISSDYHTIKEVIEVLDDEPLFNDELFQLADYISKRFVSSKISVYKTMLPPALRPTSNHTNIIMEDYVYPLNSSQSLTTKQELVWNTIKDKLPMKASQFRKESKSIAKKLIEKGYVYIKKVPKTSTLISSSFKDTNHSLTPQQKKAIETIIDSDALCFLLHGVTGSGKTEVFLQLAQSVLEKGKQVLFLVPEIGLTPMMIQRVSARFGDKIAIYHSHLNAQEKYSQYCLVRDKKVNIVVGTRSAVFMPFDQLGLILMDEEHDTSYKQDSMPRYHTRDIALWRGKYHHCKVVLASATPSLESYSRAYKGIYQLVSLTKRVNDSMPNIQLIDLKKEKVQYGLSQTLIDAIHTNLLNHKQSVILLNRRGYTPIMRCMDCNEVLTCPDCGIALSYHKYNNSLVCHICGNTYQFQNECPNCHGTHFYDSSFGTERLEENLSLLFPNAHIVRMDADSTRKKNAHEKLLNEFEEKGDILIGTQMVAKGLDFERVTLVGILQADQALVHMDYRSSETAYEMLEQASGRSGRGSEKGRVLIQAFDLDHYVMKSVLSQNYLSFFQYEMKYRHLGQYPPYVFMCTLIFMHHDLNTARQIAIECKEYLKDLKVLGPIEITMRKKQKRVRLIVKAKSEESLNQRIWDLVLYHRLLKTKVKMDINMYPLLLED